MPKIEIINGVEIKVYRGDHNPPHVHLFGPGFKISICLDTFKIIAGKYDRKAKNAISWIKENQKLLIEKWDQYNG